MAALPQVSVVIPTRGRPASLVRAMRSVFAQTGVGLDAIELVIVDNDAGRGAEPTVEQLKSEAPFEVVYACEPSPGEASSSSSRKAISGAREATRAWLRALATPGEGSHA